MILRRLARTVQDARPGLRDAPLAFSLRGAPLGVESLTPKLSRPQPGGANGGEGGLDRCYLKGRRSGWGPTSNAGLGPARQ